MYIYIYIYIEGVLVTFPVDTLLLLFIIIIIDIVLRGRRIIINNNEPSAGSPQFLFIPRSERTRVLPIRSKSRYSLFKTHSAASFRRFETRKHLNIPNLVFAHASFQVVVEHVNVDVSRTRGQFCTLRNLQAGTLGGNNSVDLPDSRRFPSNQ